MSMTPVEPKQQEEQYDQTESSSPLVSEEMAQMASPLGSSLLKRKRNMDKKKDPASTFALAASGSQPNNSV